MLLTLFRPPTTSSSPRLGFKTSNQNSNRYYLRNGEGYAFQIFYAHSKTFRALINKAHHAVIFAIAQLSFNTMSYSFHVLSTCFSVLFVFVVFCFLCSYSLRRIYTWHKRQVKLVKATLFICLFTAVDKRSISEESRYGFRSICYDS